MTKSFTITTQVSISRQRVADILCDALEGGSNYWYFIEDFVKPPKLDFRSDKEHIFKHLDYPLNEGGELVIKDILEEEVAHIGKTFKVNLTTIKKGLEVMAEKEPRHFCDFMREDDDATTADVFLQCVCFGEAIYS